MRSFKTPAHGLKAPSPNVRVSCLCGQKLELPREAIGDEQRASCPECRRIFEVVIETDPATGLEDAFPVFVEGMRAEAKASDSNLVEPTPVAPEVATVQCSCGQMLRVRQDVFGRVVRCPGCASQMKVQLKTSQGRVEVEIQFVDQKQPKKVSTGSFMFVTCPCGEQLTLRYAAGQMSGCRKCGRGVSLFFQDGGEAVPVFVDGARPL